MLTCNKAGMDRNKAKSLATIVPPKTFPYCLVWTPIPLISWLIPYVGHMGLANARGVIMVGEPFKAAFALRQHTCLL